MSSWRIILAIIGITVITVVVFLAALGVFVFGETLNRYEVAGLAFAVIAIVLLGRFGG